MLRDVVGYGSLFRVIAALAAAAALGHGPIVSAADSGASFAGCTLRTLILSAYPAEADSVLSKTTLDKSPVVKAKTHTFYAGTISGKPVLVGMTGIGLVNASNATEDALTNLTCNSTHTFVGAVLFSGVAGSTSKAQIGDVAAPRRWTLDDGKTFHPVDPAMLAAAAALAAAKAPTLGSQETAGNPGCTGVDPKFVPLVDLARVPKVHVGGDGASADSLGGQAGECIPDAGDFFGCQPCDAPDRSPADPQATVSGATSWLSQNAGGIVGAASSAAGKTYDAIDEETAAVQTVADKHTVPFLGFRGISDGPGDPLSLPNASLEFYLYKQLAADNVAAAVEQYMLIWNGPIAPAGFGEGPIANLLQPVFDQFPNVLANFVNNPFSLPPSTTPAGVSTTPTTAPLTSFATPKTHGSSSSHRSAFDWVLVAIALALVGDAAFSSRRRPLGAKIS